MKNLIFGFLAMLMTMSVNAQANGKNPVDMIGRIHNDLVQQFLDQFGGTTLPTAMVVAEIQKIAAKHPELSKYKTSSKPIDPKFIDQGRADFKNNFKNVISNLNTSQVVKTEVQKLIDYHFTIAFKKEKTSYNDYYNYIVAFENSILNNNSIISPDKNIILAGSAIARHSVHMWEREYNGGGSGLGFWDYVLVGVCDLAGGVVGYVTSGGNFSTTVQQGASASTSANEAVSGKRN